MKVSIITVSYNSARTIDQTIKSVLSQDYSSIEYIIIDGGSKDGTVDIIKSHLNGIQHFVSEPDLGIYDAMNKGINLATGDVVGILNSDDIFMSASSVSTFINTLTARGVDAVFSDLLVVDPLNTDRQIRYYNSGNFSPAKFKYGWMPAHPTFYVKRSVYQKAGQYDLDFKIAADFDMMVRLFCGYSITHAYIPRPLIKMRKGGASSAGLIANIILNIEIIRACKKNGIYTNIFFLLLKIPKKLKELF